MQIRMPFEEVHKYFADHYQKDVDIRYVDEKTMSIGTTLKVGPFTKDVSVGLAVEKVEDNDLFLSSTSGLLVDLIINAIVSYLSKNGQYSQIIDKCPDDFFAVRLSKMDKLKKTFDALTLRNVSFDGSSIILDANIK